MRVRVWVGLAGWCVLAGTRWLVDVAVPPTLPGLLRMGVHHLVLLVGFGIWSLARRTRLSAGWGWIGALAGVVWLLPNAVIELAGGRVSGLTEAVVFTLAPVVVVFAVAQQRAGFGDEGDTRRLVGPALAGVVGAALLIPFTMPASGSGKAWLAALVVSVVAAALAAVALHRALRGVDMVASAMVSSGVIAVVAMGLGWGNLGAWRGMDAGALGVEAVVAVGVDGPLLLLGLWLLREMAPVGVVTRYTVALLVTIVESYFLMHGSAGWVMGVGALLMAGSAGWLLRAASGTVMGAGDSGSTLGL